MKALLKFVLFAAVLTAVVVVITERSRRRATAPAGPAPAWRPPSVETPPPSGVPEVDAQAVDLAADEGMSPPPEEPAVDEAVHSTGTPVVAATEFAAPAPAEPAEPAPEALETADAEGMAPAAEPPADIAISSGGEPLISELARPDAAAEAARPEPDMLERILDSEEEGMQPPPDEPGEDLAIDEAGEVVISELAAPGAAEAFLRGEASATEEPDFLTRYFDELAASGEEAASEPASEAVPEAPEELAEPTADAPAQPEALFDSVEQALDDLEPAAIVPPPRRTAESYLDEGNVYFNVGQYGLAIERYGQAIELDADLTAAYYNRANAHTRAGDFEKALADYDRALQLQPNDADALNNRGMLHLYRANYAAALKDFNGALAADPTDTTVMVNRGLAHLHGGDAAAALIDFREATRMDDRDAAAQYGAAQASASLGNRDEALRHVTRALELDPAYAREAAADPRLALLQGDEEFLRLLRQSGSRSGG